MIEVKICGVCRPEDARAAEAAGAAYVGVIVAAGGPRERTPDEAAAIFAAAAGVSRVGVFADRPAAAVIALAERLGLDVVQLHGNEPPDIVAEIADAGPWQVWKVVHPTRAEELSAAVQRWRGAVAGLLVDGSAPGRRGGSGVRAPWDVLARARWAGAPRLVLAGGLRPGNVADASARLRPDVVDVSSGVEAAVGRKSAALIDAFVRAARETSAELRGPRR